MTSKTPKALDRSSIDKIQECFSQYSIDDRLRDDCISRWVSVGTEIYARRYRGLQRIASCCGSAARSKALRGRSGPVSPEYHELLGGVTTAWELSHLPILLEALRRFLLHSLGDKRSSSDSISRFAINGMKRATMAMATPETHVISDAEFLDWMLESTDRYGNVYSSVTRVVSDRSTYQDLFPRRILADCTTLPQGLLGLYYKMREPHEYMQQYLSEGDNASMLAKYSSLVRAVCDCTKSLMQRDGPGEGVVQAAASALAQIPKYASVLREKAEDEQESAWAHNLIYIWYDEDL